MNALAIAKAAGLLRTTLAAILPLLTAGVVGFAWGVVAALIVIVAIGAWSWFSKKRIQLVDR